MSNIRFVTLTWKEDLRFEGGTPGEGQIPIDSDGPGAPGPMQLLLLAVASCSGADVVSMMPKMQVKLARCEVDVRGVRREEYPRRYTSIHLTFRLAGEGLDETKARRAVDLSIEKYCSVIHSLNPDIPLTYDLELG